MSIPQASGSTGPNVLREDARITLQRKHLNHIDGRIRQLMLIPNIRHEDEMRLHLELFFEIVECIRGAPVQGTGDTLDQRDHYNWAYFERGHLAIVNMAEQLRKYFGQERPSDLAQWSFPTHPKPPWECNEPPLIYFRRTAVIDHLIRSRLPAGRASAPSLEQWVLNIACSEDAFQKRKPGGSVKISALPEEDVDDAWRRDMFRYSLFALFGIAKLLSTEKRQRAIKLWDQGSRYMEPDRR